MTVSDIARILKAEVLCEGDSMEAEVHTACGSDMMSDVLAYVKDQSVLLTGARQLAGGAHRRNDGYGLHRLRARASAPTNRSSPSRASGGSPCFRPPTACLPPAGCFTTTA